ncbi:MAG: MBL fold metallo-hydrolase [Hyphomicrobiales bacterium]
MTIRATILGCGSSGGVPRIGGDWGVCDPANPKNRRRRCSIMLEQQGQGGTTRVVIDTSPDLRDQMLTAEVQAIDGVWFTHEHADHTHGIDELRAFFLRQRRRVPVWADQSTAGMLLSRFSYCFLQPQGSDYPQILDLHTITPGVAVETAGAGGVLKALPFVVRHGAINALGFRVGGMAYTPDLNGIADESLPLLSGLDIWIVDALKRTPHVSHFSLPETLDWIARLKPRRAIITNMHVDLDYAKLCEELPHNIRPAFDGMVIDL